MQHKYYLRFWLSICSASLAVSAPRIMRSHLKAAQAMGLRVCSEVFADRAYSPDGTLVPRGLPGAMIENEEDAIVRVVQMAKQGTVCAADGSTVTLQADSVCVHGDGRKALCFVKQLSEALPAAGIEIKAHNA